MLTGMFLNNPNYVEYVRLLKELTLLMMAGEEDTDATEAIRDAMDRPWYNLSPEEMESVGILSASLRMLEGKEVFRDVPPEQRTREWLAPRMQSAWERQDWASTPSR